MKHPATDPSTQALAATRRHHYPAATVARIAAQLKADPRTVALVLVVPALLLTLLYYVFKDVPVPPGGRATFDRIGPIMLAVLPMLLMFIVTSVVMLRERTSGTLERVLATPLGRWNLVASYALVFALLAVCQSVILGALILGAFGVEIAGPEWVLFLVAVLDAVFGVAFGLLASAFARTEFQAVQFMPLFIGPQIFLCGLLVPTDQMPRALEIVAQWLPMTLAVDAVRELMQDTSVSETSWLELGGLAVAVFAALLLAASTMPRQTK